MALKRTLGKWWIHDNRDSRPIEILATREGMTNADRVVAQVMRETWHNHDEEEANARLIAKAPELWETLAECLRYLADLNGSNWIDGDDTGSVDMRQRAKGLQQAAYRVVSEAAPEHYGKSK